MTTVLHARYMGSLQEDTCTALDLRMVALFYAFRLCRENASTIIANVPAQSDEDVDFLMDLKVREKVFSLLYYLDYLDYLVDY